jgi:hypothetical protein
MDISSFIPAGAESVELKVQRRDDRGNPVAFMCWIRATDKRARCGHWTAATPDAAYRQAVQDFQRPSAPPASPHEDLL